MGFSLFKKPLYDTTIEVLCQNTGRTFRLRQATTHKSYTCRHCGRETWVVNIKEGKGNVEVLYVGADQTPRPLHAIHTDEGKQVGMAGYEADSGTFLLISQEKP
jgi:hypothetical protein